MYIWYTALSEKLLLIMYIQTTNKHPVRQLATVIPVPLVVVEATKRGNAGRDGRRSGVNIDGRRSGVNVDGRRSGVNVDGRRGRAGRLSAGVAVAVDRGPVVTAAFFTGGGPRTIAIAPGRRFAVPVVVGG